VARGRDVIRSILDGTDPRLFVVIGHAKSRLDY